MKTTGITLVQTFGKKSARRTSAKRPIKPSRVFIYVLALAAIGGGGYLLVSRLRRKKAGQANSDGSSPASITINNTLPTSYGTSVIAASNAGKDGFPLKKGSKGTRVAQLQQALASIIGQDVMKANGGIDGIFGKGTAKALKRAGYQDVVDEATFNQILSKASSSLTVVFNPSAIAASIYKAAQSKDLDGVLKALNQVGSVEQYSAVNEYYKKSGLITKTIVTDLLSIAFKDDEDSKDAIKNEFNRMGLKVDDAGKWSLQGIRLYRDLITMRRTVVVDSDGHRIPVERNTILGDQIKILNGMTWFRSIDNSLLSVPTQDVKYNS